MAILAIIITITLYLGAVLSFLGFLGYKEKEQRKYFCFAMIALFALASMMVRL